MTRNGKGITFMMCSGCQFQMRSLWVVVCEHLNIKNIEDREKDEAATRCAPMV